MGLASGCKPSDSDRSLRSTESACFADSIQTLRETPTLPAWTADDVSCRDACLAGDAVYCLSRVYALEKNPVTMNQAAVLYQRACRLGLANACTNYAAGIRANPHTADQLACARRTFEKACDAKEVFACGMVGRMMFDEAKIPKQFKEVRRYLESACHELNGFPCRALAQNLETGKLGDYDPKLIRKLLQQACAGGDPDACGEPATATETFR